MASSQSRGCGAALPAGGATKSPPVTSGPNALHRAPLARPAIIAGTAVGSAVARIQKTWIGIPIGALR